MLTSITLAFADGEYDFALPIGQINEIQNRCGAGIGEIYGRVLAGRMFQVTPEGHVAVGDPIQARYRIEDLTNVIRQGLIGGGRCVVDGKEEKVTPHRANQLIETYVLGPGCPLKDAWALAAAVLQVAIEGYEPPEPTPETDKKKEDERTEKGGSTTKRRSRPVRQ